MKVNEARSQTLAFTAALLAVVGSMFIPTPAGVSTQSYRRPASQANARPDRERISEVYGQLPLQFEANQGQDDPSVKFLSRGPGYGVFLTPTEVVLVLSKKASPQAAVVRMQLVGANPDPELTGIEELPGKSNYLIGRDPARWHTNLPTYGKVRYREVYSGIDSIYYGNGRQLEYDFVVAPGADPNAIRLGFNGSEHVSIDASGDLLVQANGEQLRLHKPIVYQNVSGNRLDIPAEYVLVDGRNVSFDIGRYDTEEPLIIDPVVSYATYLGGGAADIADGIAVDSSGYMYLTGATSSLGLSKFPTTPGAMFTQNQGMQDAFVTKINPNGTPLVYSTYLGGANDDYGAGIAVDSTGNVYLTGYTRSTNFPIPNAIDSTLSGSQDAFIAKLNPGGSAFIYSTYLGGEVDEAGTGLAIDTSQNVYVIGNTNSGAFPVVNATTQPAYAGGAHDVFVAKLNASGSSYEYATYLGGTGDDIGTAIEADESGNAYVTGTTDSFDFPRANARQPTYGGGAHDVFVTKFNTDGQQRVFSTYHGGASDDVGFGIAVDGSGNVYVTGGTISTDFPTANAYQPSKNPGGDQGAYDAFVSKFSPDGSGFVYSTYLGGSIFEQGFGIAVDGSENAYVVGLTVSTDFPLSNATQTILNGPDALPNECVVPGVGVPVNCSDVFISKFSPNGSALLFSTYLGGRREELSRDITVVSGIVYLDGGTQSQNFPTKNPFQANKGAGLESDAFVARIEGFDAKKVRGQVISQ
jgi:hypothetical protein